MPEARKSDGKTLQDRLEGLGAAVKRKRDSEDGGQEQHLSSATKRICILREELPLVAMTNVKQSTEMGSAMDENNKTTHGGGELNTKTDNITADTIKNLQDQKRVVQKDMERLEEKRKAFFAKQSDLVGVYMFGLEKISKLNDVREAPDAILPGNQP